MTNNSRKENELRALEPLIDNVENGLRRGDWESAKEDAEELVKRIRRIKLKEWARQEQEQPPIVKTINSILADL